MDKEFKEIFERWDKKRKERLEKAMERQFCRVMFMVCLIIFFILVVITLAVLFPIKHS
jgi:type IV secretory pathway component VirB8